MISTVSTKVTLSTSRRIRFSLVEMQAIEAVSRPYHAELAVKGSANLDLERMLGMGISVRIDQPGPEGRYLHGHVERVSAGPVLGKTGRYDLLVVPALAELARCGRHRVFTQVRAPDLIAEILSAHAIAFDSRLSQEHAEHDMVVQYNESDLDFVSRLMDHEGIFYYFEHAADGHKLIMLDDPKSLVPWPDYETQSLLSASGQGEGIVRLDPSAAARVTRVELDDVNPASPALDLASAAGVMRRGESCATRSYYPGSYDDPADGAARAAIRLNAERVGYVSASGTAASRGIAAGHRFALYGHPGLADGRQLVPIETRTHLQAGPPTAAGSKLVIADMHCELTATPADGPMPLPLVERRPDLRGPHTAVVAGPDGETVHVDALGRVQVRFPWQDEDDPAPWVRVSQNWAGVGRGTLTIPRIGDEVLIEFEHGDARRPILVGALYNGDAPPPLSLPADKSQTLMQTRSLGGGVANRVRADDTHGGELLALEAGRDHLLTVANDAVVEVGHSLAETVSGDRTTTVDGDMTSTIDGSTTVSLGNNLTLYAGRRFDMETGRAMTVTADDMLTLSVGKKLTVSGQQAIVIRNQKASIELQADGDIIIHGNRVTVRADGRLTLKGSDVIEQEG